MQETKTSFHTASPEEIKSARVADVYFHRTMAVLRARDAENVPVHAELTYKTSEPKEWFGIPATGTLPHALVLILGSTAEAAKAFDEVVSPDVPRAILIDTFDDEKFGAILAAEAIPESIFAVRLDTPGNRRGDFPDLMREVRWELDSRGFEHVMIYASGSIGVEDILELNPYCDAYGVGGSIAAAPMVDYSLDIVD